MKLKFSTATYEKCKQEFIAFKNANRDTERDERHFDWRYLKRPCELKPIIVWAENGNSKKVGALSVVPHHYSIDNKVYPLGILGDISVSKEYRGQGIAKQMFNFLSGLDEIKKLRACIVLPNEDAARPLEKAGWHTVSRLQRYVKILNVKKRLKGKIFLEAISPFINFLLELLSYETFLKELPDFKGEITDNFDERFDELWNSLKKDGIIIGLRNKEYLRWRYSLHPTVKYQIFTLSNKNTDLSLVLPTGGERKGEGEERLCGYIVFHINEDICYIDDVLCLDEKKYPIYLLFYFLRHIKENKLASSIYISANKNNLSKQLLYKFGFIKRHDYQKFMLNLNGTIDNTQFFLKSDSWVLTAGDKDV